MTLQCVLCWYGSRSIDDVELAVRGGRSLVYWSKCRFSWSSTVPGYSQCRWKQLYYPYLQYKQIGCCVEHDLLVPNLILNCCLSVFVGNQRDCYFFRMMGTWVTYLQLPRQSVLTTSQYHRILCLEISNCSTTSRHSTLTEMQFFTGQFLFIFPTISWINPQLSSLCVTKQSVMFRPNVMYNKKFSII